VDGPAFADQEPLAVPVVGGQLPGQLCALGGQAVDAVHIGEERLPGIGLLPLQEPERGQVGQPGGQPPVTEGPDGLGDVEGLGTRGQAVPPLGLGLRARDATRRIRTSIAADGTTWPDRRRQ